MATIPAAEDELQIGTGEAVRTGNIFGIERYCTRDGPGIRTTVFFKGCPLRCAWCHNPESQSGKRQILFAEEKCISCGACVVACENGAHRLLVFNEDPPWHIFVRDQCRVCGSCVESCPAGALETVGRRVTVEEVMREVLEDRVFYAASGGGLTLSGGEPTAQINFAVALLEAAKKEGLHCCMETSGFTSWANFERLLPWVDLFLFDYKESDPQLHLDYTGRPNDAILRNLKALHDRGAAIQLQCPIIPGYNQREEHLRAIADLAEWLPGITGVMLLPYHQLGTEKLKRLGMPEGDNSLSAPGQVELARWTGLLRERGVRVLN